MVAIQPYEIVIAPEVSTRWGSLSPHDLYMFEERLGRVALQASEQPATWPVREAGSHRGEHRVLIGELWLTYRTDDQARTVSVIGFGRNDGGPLG